MATRLVTPLYQAVDANGDPGDGWKLTFYETGTTTLKDTYSDEALTVVNANPVICNSDGRPANTAGDPVDIFGVSKEDYKVILLDADDNVIETKDPVDSVTYNINSFDPRPAQHWGTTTGTADAFLIRPDPSITAYGNDLLFTIQPHSDNNAGSSLAVFKEGTVSTYLAALNMMKYDNAGAKIALEAGDNQAGQTYIYRIDGTDAVCLNPGIPYLDAANTVNTSKIFYTNTTINVPADYATIQLAIDSLQDKRINDGVTVTIKVADNTYNITGFVDLDYRYGEKVELIGNVGTPANCILNFTTGGLHIRDNNVFSKIDGFTIQSTEWTAHGIWSSDGYTAISAINGAVIMSIGSNMVITKCYYGIKAGTGGKVFCLPGVDVSEAGDAGYFCFGSGSVLHAFSCSASYCADTANTLGFGFVAENNGWVWANSASSTFNGQSGFFANGNGAMWVDGATGSDNVARNGFECERVSNMQILSATADDNGQYGAYARNNAYILQTGLAGAGNGIALTGSAVGGIIE